jgi:1-deoxy-D-xylulose-5-phosphate synthase
LQNNYNVSLKRLGVPDIFIEQGNVEELHKECGIDIMQIKDIIVQVSINK